MMGNMKDGLLMSKALVLTCVELTFLVLCFAATASCSLAPNHNIHAKSHLAADGSSADAWDASQYPVVPSQSDGFKLVAKKILGLPADSDDSDTAGAAGLIKVALLLGYAWPDNDCHATWRMDPSGSGADMALRIYAPHTGDDASGNSRPACQNRYANQPVAYTLASWKLAGQVQKVGYDDGDPELNGDGFTPAAAPAQASSSVSHGPVTSTVQPNGSVIIDAPDIVELTVGGGNGKVSGQVNTIEYTRAIATSHVTTLTSSSSSTDTSTIGFSSSQEVGFTVGDAAAGASFSAKVSFTESAEQSHSTTTGTSTGDQTGTTQTTSHTCRSQIPVVPGCTFKATLTAHYRETRSKFNTLIRILPQRASMEGAVHGTSNNNADEPSTTCVLRNDSCQGQTVTTNLGDPSHDFIWGLNDIVTHGGDDQWKWGDLRGPDGIDPSLTMLQNRDFGGFSIAGRDTLQGISSCDIQVDYVSGPSDTCQVPEVEQPQVVDANGQPVSQP